MRNFIYVLVALIIIVGGYFVLIKNPIPMQPAQQKIITSPTPQPTTQSQMKEFTMTAKQFEFLPGEIRVKEGDTVRLKITSIDVTHGFSLPDFGINQTLEPNNEVIVNFVANKKGEFTFACSVPCGEGHREMKGKLIIE